MARRGLLRIGALIVVMALAPACGGDHSETPTAAGSPVTTVVGDPELYCSLTEQLDKEGNQAFKELESDENATDKDYEKAEREFAESHQDDFDALVQAAPEEIKQDIAIVIASIKSRGGIGPKVPQKDASAAEKDIQSYEKENC